ncbi:MAG: O-antigen polymerase [Nitrospira sp.]
MLPLLTASLLVSKEFQSYFDRPEKFMTLGYFVIGLFGIFAFCTGAYLGSRVQIMNKGMPARAAYFLDQHHQRVVVWSCVILVVTLAAYALYLWPIVIHPGLFLDILTGDEGAASAAVHTKELVRIPGITSFAQLGIVYIVLFMLRVLYLPRIPLSRLERSGFVILIALATVRSIVYSERLAIIELILPALVLACRRPKLPPLLMALMPVLAIGILFLFFSSTEYFRSWQEYYRYIESEFLHFASYRLFGYYVIALDNGAGFLDHLGGSIGPVLTFQWLWSFPVDFGQYSLLQALGFDREAYGTFLHYYADEELNNGSGLFSPFLDYGVSGGAIFWFILGAVSGQLFRSDLNGGVLGLLLYPTWYTSIIEILRVFNFTSTRYFPALVVSLCLIVWFQWVGRPAASARFHRQHSLRYARERFPGKNAPE